MLLSYFKQTDPEMDSRHAKTILIAEDNIDSRIMLRLYLESFNYNVVEAVNGKEAVQLADQNLPDLILMDLNMPELDGVAATKQIRQNPQLQEIPIIANSSNGKCGIDFFTNIDSMGKGFISYLTKPISLNELSDQIDMALTASKQAI